jgi:prevent-host-death family protein
VTTRYTTCVSRPSDIPRISSSEARANLAALLERVGDGGERVLIERRGKSPVALVSADDFLRFQLLEALQSRSGDGRR